MNSQSNTQNRKCPVFFKHYGLITQNRYGVPEMCLHMKNVNWQMDEESWTAKLLLFQENPWVLSCNDREVLHFSAEDIQRMTGYTRKRLVQKLEALWDACRMELGFQESRQRMITYFFSHTVGRKYPRDLDGAVVEFQLILVLGRGL